MGHLLAWALSTGFVTGAAWLGIVVIGRGRRVAARQALSSAVDQRLAELAELRARLTEAEARVDYAELTLLQRRAEARPFKA